MPSYDVRPPRTFEKCASKRHLALASPIAYNYTATTVGRSIICLHEKTSKFFEKCILRFYLVVCNFLWLLYLELPAGTMGSLMITKLLRNNFHSVTDYIT